MDCLVQFFRRRPEPVIDSMAHGRSLVPLFEISRPLLNPPWSNCSSAIDSNHFPPAGRDCLSGCSSPSHLWSPLDSNPLAMHKLLLERSKEALHGRSVPAIAATAHAALPAPKGARSVDRVSHAITPDSSSSVLAFSRNHEFWPEASAHESSHQLALRIG
jgi:hypothetical protein